jgi:hypothetical protein
MTNIKKTNSFLPCFLKDSQDGEAETLSSRLEKLKKLNDYSQHSFDLFCIKVESQKKRLKQLESWLVKRQKEKGNESRLKAKIKKQKQHIEYLEMLLKTEKEHLEEDKEEFSNLSKSIKE